MKKALLILGLIFCGVEASAQQVDSQVVKSTWAVLAVKCSSATTPVLLNETRPTGFVARVVGYRIQNLHATEPVFLSGRVDMSTGTLATRGLHLAGLASIDLQLGNKQDQGNPLIPIYCLASDASAAAGAHVAVVWYGL